MNEYKITRCNYKLMSGKWKIAVLFECGYKFCTDDELCNNFMKISDNIYFVNTEENLLPKEISLFCRGLKMVENQIKGFVNISDNLVIALCSMAFSDCDIQEEAFTMSAIQWASETFNFPMPNINITFDSSKGINGMYVFDFL